jgi:hypothetical protein
VVVVAEEHIAVAIVAHEEVSRVGIGRQRQRLWFGSLGITLSDARQLLGQLFFCLRGTTLREKVDRGGADHGIIALK